MAIPLSHPRLWFYGNDRLQYLRTRVGSAEWTYMLSKLTSNQPFEMWIPLLKWKITGAAADLTSSLARLDTLLGYFDTSANVIEVLDNGNGTKDGLQLHQACRNLALYYDWGYDDAGGDVLGATRRARTANAMLIAVKTVMNPNTDITQFSAWGLDNPYNNHNFQQMVACTYVALALYNEQPLSYTFPWSGGPSFEFTIPRDTDSVVSNAGFSGTKVYDTDLWTWLQNVIVDKQLPAILSLEAWTDEGTNYGRSSVHRCLELYSILKSTVGADYISQYPVFAKHGEFHLYAIQPGNKLSVNFGDQPRDNRALLEGGDRQISLLIADSIDAYPVREYQQFWMNNFYPAMDNSVYAAFNFLLYRHDRGTVDYRTQLPTSFRSNGVGFFNSRDTWNDDAFSVNMLGGYRHEEKHHSDFGAIQIYKGPPPASAQLGWLIIDATLRSGATDDDGNKDDWSAHWHSCPRIATSVFPNGWPQHRYRNTGTESMDRFWHGTDYKYCRANGDDVFWTTDPDTTKASFREGVSQPVARICDTFRREVVHLVSGNYVLVFDRFKTASAFTLSTTKAIIPWHTINQATESGSDRAYAESNSYRIWRKTFHKPVGTTYQNRDNSDLIYSDTTGSRSFRQEHTIPLSTGSAYILNVLQGTNTASTMTTINEVPASGVGLPLDHTMVGVTIVEAPPKHFLFSITADGSVPSVIRYYVQKTGGTDVHRVYGLTPNQEYTLFESAAPIVGSYYLYTLTPTFNVGRYANSEGVVEFTPDDIGTIGTVYYNVSIDDAGASPDSVSTISTQCTFKLGIADNTGEDSKPMLFADNFDDLTSVAGLFVPGRWTNKQEQNGGVLAIESTIVHTPGGKSLKCSVPAFDGVNAVKACVQVEALPGMVEGGSFFADFWMYVTTAAAYSTVAFLDLEDPDEGEAGTSPGRMVYLNTAPRFRTILNKWYYTDQIDQTDATLYPTNQWVHVQVWMYLSGDSTKGRVQMWRDGFLTMDGYGATLPAITSESHRMQIGISASQSPNPIVSYIDDVRLYACHPDQLRGSESTADGDYLSRTYRVSLGDSASQPAVSTVGLTDKITINDTGIESISEVTIQHTGPENPDIEKRIDGPIATLVPNQDISISFFVMNPTTGNFYDKLDDSDDADYIRVHPYAVPSSYAIFGLSDSSGAVGTVHTIQFAAKIKSAQFAAINSPVLRMDLYRNMLDEAPIAIYDIPLYATSTSVWLRSPVIQCVVEQKDLPNLKLGVRPRASSYTGTYNLDISAVLVDVSGSSPEKVI